MKKMIARFEAFCGLLISLTIILVTTVGFQWVIWTEVYQYGPFWAIATFVIAIVTGVWALSEFGKLLPLLVITIFTGKETRDDS
jgi:hypothetical protein